MWQLYQDTEDSASRLSLKCYLAHFLEKPASYVSSKMPHHCSSMWFHLQIYYSKCCARQVKVLAEAHIPSHLIISWNNLARKSFALADRRNARSKYGGIGTSSWFNRSEIRGNCLCPEFVSLVLMLPYIVGHPEWQRNCHPRVIKENVFELRT